MMNQEALYDPYGELDDDDRERAVRAPALHISRDDLAKIQCYIDNCKAEISGMAHLHQEAGEMIIHSPILLEQEVSACTTDICPESLGNAVAEIATSGGDPSTLICWWHSHYNMPTFWSATDDATIEMLADFTDILISIVGNVSGEWKARIDIFKPTRMTADVDLGIYDSVSKEIENFVKSEIKEKVTRKRYQPKVRFGITPRLPLPSVTAQPLLTDEDDQLLINGYDEWYL